MTIDIKLRDVIADNIISMMHVGMPHVQFTHCLNLKIRFKISN